VTRGIKLSLQARSESDDTRLTRAVIAMLDEDLARAREALPADRPGGAVDQHLDWSEEPYLRLPYVHLLSTPVGFDGAGCSALLT